jgi:hypothetical protein
MPAPSGRRTAADDMADAIAVAAGLPPLRPREERVSRRQAWIRLPVAVALIALAATIGQASGSSGGLVPSAAQLAGKRLALAAAALI